MIRMVTPNTNVSAGSINTTFLKDKAVTGDKIATTGALDKQVLSYDLATDTVIWQDVSYLDNTFENGIIVSNAPSIFFDDVRIDGDIDLNGDISISGTIADLAGISADSSFLLETTGPSQNITIDPSGYLHAETTNFYVGTFSQAIHVTPTSIGSIGTAPEIFASTLDATSTLDVSGVATFADDVVVTGSVSSKNTTIGDTLVSGVYPGHGFTIEGGDGAWGTVTIDEYVGDGTTGKPFSGFTNPGFVGQVWGGTIASQADVPSGKRLVGVYAQAAYDNSGTYQMPPSAPGRLIFSTTETHTSTGRGTKLELQTTPNSSTNRNTFTIQGDAVTINTSGNGYISTGNQADDSVVFNNRIQLDQLSSDPTTNLAAGQMYFNTTTSKFRGYDGTNWVDLN